MTRRQRDDGGRRLRVDRIRCVQALAGGVTHEINNLFASVVLSVDLLEPCCRNASDREMLEALSTLAGKLRHAGRQLELLARGGPGEPTLFQPQYLLADVQKLAAVAFPPTASLVTRYPSDLQALAADPLPVHQLLLAMALEALNHLPPEGGTVVLAARNAGREELAPAAAVPGAGPAAAAPAVPAPTGAASAASFQDHCGARGQVVVEALVEARYSGDANDGNDANNANDANNGHGEATRIARPRSQGRGATSRFRPRAGGRLRWAGAVERAAQAAGAALEVIGAASPAPGARPASGVVAPGAFDPALAPAAGAGSLASVAGPLDPADPAEPANWRGRRAWLAAAALLPLGSEAATATTLPERSVNSANPARSAGPASPARSADLASPARSADLASPARSADLASPARSAGPVNPPNPAGPAD